MKLLERLRKVGFSKLTLLEDALAELHSYLTVIDNEDIEVSTSLNRILAEDIITNMDLPPFDRSAMDGYAVKAEDTFGASQNNPKQVIKIGTVEIGEIIELIIEKGQAIRISTGAPIPKGADAVVKIEDTEIDNELITLYAPLAPGKNISKKGEDIVKGIQIMIKGTELKPEHIALLSSLGRKTVKVKIKPKVSVFSVGDELIETGNSLEPGKIFNSNTSMISNLITLYGGELVRGLTLPDNKETIKNNLDKAINDSQIIVFTGGTSVGTKDLLPEVIHENGTVLTHGIAMRPGSPILIGISNEKVVFCLPGTPVAAYICFLKIVGPTLRKLMKCINIDPRVEVKASIEHDIPVSSMGFLNFLRVKIEKKEDDFIAIPVKLKGSGVITSLTQSDGIIEITPNLEGLKKGDNVIIKLFPK